MNKSRNKIGELLFIVIAYAAIVAIPLTIGLFALPAMIPAMGTIVAFTLAGIAAVIALAAFVGLTVWLRNRFAKPKTLIKQNADLSEVAPVNKSLAAVAAADVDSLKNDKDIFEEALERDIEAIKNEHLTLRNKLIAMADWSTTRGSLAAGFILESLKSFTDNPSLKDIKYLRLRHTGEGVNLLIDEMIKVTKEYYAIKNEHLTLRNRLIAMARDYWLTNKSSRDAREICKLLKIFTDNPSLEDIKCFRLEYDGKPVVLLIDEMIKVTEEYYDDKTSAQETPNKETAQSTRLNK